MKTIYVAETTPDLKEKRDSYISELKQYAVKVVPEAPLPTQPAAAREKIREALKQADLSVHLMGGTACRAVGNSERCIVQLQFKVAEEIATEDERPLLTFVPNTIRFGKNTSMLENRYYEFVITVLKQRRPVKVFYSYAHETGAELLKRLKTNLAAQRKHALRMIDWCDSSIEPGEDWDDRIRSELHRSDMVVFLVSPGWLDSDYAFQREYLEARRLEKKCIPILVENVSLKETEVDSTQLIPCNKNKKPVPVNEWSGGNDGWVIVAEQIGAALQRMQVDMAEEMSSQLDLFRERLSDLKDSVAKRLGLEKVTAPNAIPSQKPHIFLAGVCDLDLSSESFSRLRDSLKSRARLYPAVPEKERDERRLIRSCDGVVFLNSTEGTVTMVQERHMEASSLRGAGDLPKLFGIVNIPPPACDDIATHLPNDDDLVVLDGTDGVDDSLLQPLWDKLNSHS